MPLITRSLSVANANGSTLTNQPVRMSLPIQTGMRADFADVRFVDGLGNPIPRWIETVTSGVSAAVWFKPSSLVAGTTALSLLYGGGVLGAQDINNVFLFGDDFSGTTRGYNRFAAGNPIINVGTSGTFDDTLVADPCVVYDPTEPYAFQMLFGAVHGVHGQIAGGYSPDGSGKT